MPADPKSQALAAALAQIQKEFGAGSAMRLGDAPAQKLERFPAGAISLDLALGGGYPRGRIIEIYGPESSGKTTLTLHAIAEAQKAGGTAAFIDAEHALDPEYARALGVDIENLILSQPDSGEQALDITEKLIASNAVDVLVVDSVAALTPRAEIEGEMGDLQVGLQARLMSKALRKLTSIVSRTNCTVFFINQIRMKIGVMFGNPETTTGGNALKFYSSVRLDVRRIAKIETGTGDAKEATGNRVRVKVVKNKTAPPFRQTEFDIMYGQGISQTGDLLDLAAARGIVKKSGAFFSFGETKLGQGRENAKTFLAENPEILKKIDAEVRAGGTLPAEAAEENNADDDA